MRKQIMKKKVKNGRYSSLIPIKIKAGGKVMPVDEHCATCHNRNDCPSYLKSGQYKKDQRLSKTITNRK